MAGIVRDQRAQLTAFIVASRTGQRVIDGAALIIGNRMALP